MHGFAPAFGNRRKHIVVRTHQIPGSHTRVCREKGLKRQLGAFDLTMLGIGAIIGTGIFVLTSVAADKAGPGMMYSFVIAGLVCALTALVYSEIAAIVPVADRLTHTLMPCSESWPPGW